MDIATVIGLFGGTALVASAIFMGGSAIMFLNIPGMLIVIGGTFAAAFIKFSMSDVINSFKVGIKAFTVQVDSPEANIKKMIEFAKVARKEGLIALEKAKENMKKSQKKKGAQDEFIGKALDYLATGYDQELIENMLDKEIRMTAKRHTIGQNVFKGMGDSAPAFGMIGTLIGLVQMLANMSDPSSIGPAMAVALLTTLYGALIANLVCLPLADKLALRSKEEQESRNIILDATIGISSGMAPIALEESLKTYLKPQDRRKKEGTTAQKGGKKKK
ncbi:MAG: MotA/TolQ/ExbB proton channel family protein [Deltaproteobacteria bacterium]|nr:MotA/TolQ/ExbB proton channel family protein [Deltaproteobacteria bacterium]